MPVALTLAAPAPTVVRGSEDDAGSDDDEVEDEDGVVVRLFEFVATDEAFEVAAADADCRWPPLNANYKHHHQRKRNKSIL
jgi:hypothetical protein